MTEQLVQFLIVSDGQLQVSWDNSALLVVSSSVTGQFQNFGSQVFQNSSQVDWGTGTNSLSVVTVSEQSVDSSDWEGQSSLGRS
ncbi:hypothetical protein OGAPHI_006209 [Ogataea philodendri]|uniref:Uncharacterized protein n=1 Tax=Ogataea philodendri TaxID=1378263 RepID=A0A9P8T0R1_9ASCO|nr:uncharacterized protein OGAPHI_006209 [Ogataea philodendri]KAH3662028.1 hypothetical protein OGAPHI_006209 [Ogataea philodendri]